MYRFVLGLAAIIGINCYVSGQGQEMVWFFGEHAGIDFSSGAAQAIRSGLNTGEGSATMCNAGGQLLFYTDGTQVWDRNHNIMPHGDDLPGLGRNITASTSQGALIIPVPGNQQQYYIFSLGQFSGSFATSPDLGKLFYSVVDMSLHNGLGDVTPERGILMDTGLTEQMTAVSGDDCNIWLLVIGRTQDVFKAYRIDVNGIGRDPVISDAVAGGGTSSGGGAAISAGVIGNMDVSPDRRKIATARGNLVLYDFDPVSGNVINPFTIDSTGCYYGVAFSPDNSKLYTSCDVWAPPFQFNLEVDSLQAIINTRMRLHSTNGGGGALRRAPDGKIYGAAIGSSKLHVIHFPNLAGAACQFEAYSFALQEGTQSGFGLPNVAALLNGRFIDAVHTDTIFCQESWELTARRTDGRDYFWDDSSTGKSRRVFVSGTYWVQYKRKETDAALCGTGFTDSFHIVFDRAFSNNFLPEIYTQAACKAEANGMAWVIASQVDSLAYSYIWQNEAGDAISSGDTLKNAVAGTYFLYVRLMTGCDTLLPLYISSEDHRADFWVADTVCVASSVLFENRSPSHFDSFTWTFGDGQASGGRDTRHVYTAAGFYKVTLVASGMICSDTLQKNVIVDTFPDDLRFIADRKSVCMGEAIVFAFTPDSTMRIWYWDFGDQNAFPDGSPSVSHAYDVAGNMTVRLNVQFRACPEMMYTGAITVHVLPAIDLGPDSSLCLSAAPLVLRNRQPYRDGDLYLWNTGENGRDCVVRRPGNYSLTITDKNGCSTTERVAVEKGCYAQMPNAFSPNGDGYNDYFFPKHLLTRNSVAMLLQIYDRWGQLVFETPDKGGLGWDGRFQSHEQPQGVYPYRVTITTEQRSTEYYEGNVTLIR